MSSPKLVAVYGATGSQGGSVVQSLLQNKDHTFTVRGITRNPDSEKAKALAAQGVEVVKADGFNKDQMVEAFKDCWGAFINTNSDDTTVNQPGGPTEEDLGKIIIDAAAEAGVQHVVYSSMISVTDLTKGAVPAISFDHKHAVGQHAIDKGVFKTVNLISPGWYMENHLVEELAPAVGGWPFITDDEGYLTLRVPRWGGNENIPFIAIGEDYGDLVHGALIQPEKYNGKLVHGMSHEATASELVETFDKVTGKKSRYVPIEDWRTFETYGEGSLETVKNMFGFCQYSGGLYYAEPNDLMPPTDLKRTAAEAKGLTADDAKLTTLETFLTKYFGQ